MKYPIFLLTVLFSLTCTKNAISQEIKSIQSNKLQKAYFASGCFWCVEAIYESVEGVKEVISGYAGGTTPNPTYKEVSYGRTDHAEAVEIYYNPKIISFETLVHVFYGSHDPTTLNKQGPDKGTQYRSIAFYTNESEKRIIEKITSTLNKTTYNGKIVTEIKPLNRFYKAEEYHQNYEKLHPKNSYIQNVSIPRLNSFKKKFPKLLKKNH